MSEVLKVTNLSAGYKQAVVLSNLSMSLAEGETLALLGRNGVGKTTFINTLIGATQWHAGSIELDGVAIERWPSFKRVSEPSKGGIGWVPQERNIFKSLTVDENLMAVAQKKSNSHSWDSKRVYQLFPRLAERRSNLGYQLSGGEQQMLAIGRALMVNPRLLLLDEPLEGLAPIIVEELLLALKRITKEEGLTAIVVEQHPQMILAISDQALVLEKGQSVLQDRANVLLTKPELLESLLGVKR